MIATALRKFRDANVTLSWKTTPTQLWETRGYAIYEWVARALLGRPGVDTVVDVGGGRTWYFGEDWRTNPKFKLIGIDVDPAELELNPMLDERITADVTKTLGVPDGSVDLVLCRAVVEHLSDNAAFVRNVHRALRPGGSAAFVFVNKWAPPMILNRMLPTAVSARLLHALVPGSDGICGFKAHYDKCTFTEFKRALEDAGFEVEYEYSSYYSSSYFQFFFPLHVLSILTDLVRQTLSIRNLSSMCLFSVVKPADAPSRGA